MYERFREFLRSKSISASESAEEEIRVYLTKREVGDSDALEGFAILGKIYLFEES